MKAPINSRYAHCDGITDISIFEEGDNRYKILTCGTDGDVRVWNDPDDQEPVVFSASDGCFTIFCHEKTAYVGTESNCVESFSLPDGKAKGVKAKFTATVNHLDVSKSGTFLVAGSGDMTIQILNLKDGSAAIKIDAHSAPVLSVAIDPQEEFVVSTGCDGCVFIWNIKGKQVKNWNSVIPSSNDIETSQTLCRPSWSSDGKFIAIPQKSEMVLYERESWKESKRFSAPGNKLLSVALFSQCTKFLASGCTDGTLLVWNVETGKLVYENVETKDHLTGLSFANSGNDLFAVDMKGRMIFVTDLHSSKHVKEGEEFNMDDEFGADSNVPVAKGVVAEDDPFDDDMDGMFDDVAQDEESNEFSISKIKAMSGFIKGEKEDLFVGIAEAKKIAGIKNDDDAVSVTSLDKDGPGSSKYRPIIQKIVMPYTEPQKSFQPSSSPEDLEHRFMVWNSIGIVRNYDMEDDDSDAIDIEFHDVSFHNGIHLRNQFNYTIGTLGKEAVVFASARAKGTPSKLMCLHYASWESNKEWSLDLPMNEEIIGLAAGTGWIAASTDLNRLRIFSVGGVQRNLLSFGGQIIAISGHEDLLFVTFHTGIGLRGSQHISYSIIRIKSGTIVFPLIDEKALPVTPKSEITWMGFSDEGTPAFTDSSGVLNVLNGRMWMTFLNMKEGKAEDDHFWVTGLSICSQQVRAIKCKETTYPLALPRPTILLLTPKIPLCEMDTEKGMLEESLLRSIMLNTLAKKMDKKGFDVEEYKDSAERDVKETLIKLFALSCKGDKDCRASEYVSMMPSTHAIQVAIKHANKLRKMALTERLTALGRKKLDDEEEGNVEDDVDFECLREGNIIYSTLYSAGPGNGSTSMSSHSQSNTFMSSSACNNDSTNDLMILEENPLLSRQRAEIRSVLATSVYKNPFKRSSTTTGDSSKTESEDAGKTDEGGKGLALIDAWKKPVEKPTMEFNPKHPKNKGSKRAAAEKEKEKQEKATTGGGKKQKTLFDKKGKAQTVDKTQKKLNFGTSVPSPGAADDDDSKSKFDNPDEEEISVINSIDGEEDSIDMTENGDESSIPQDNSVSKNEKKRKRSGDNNETEKKSRISSKLAAFALKRND